MLLPPHPDRTNRKRRCCAFGTAFVLLSFAATATASDVTDLHIRNAGQVNDHLFRGGEPSAEGLQNLARMHVGLVIDLREAGNATESERRTVEALHMKYANIPLPPLSAPTAPEMKRILSLIVPDDNGTIFVHCRRGKDRTGTVIACYRIQHDGWTARRALAEANSYGMSHTEWGMRSFILKFSPIDLPGPLAAGN